ncbi:hypothetical protein NN561_010429 [Cricetulus griseus]
MSDPRRLLPGRRAEPKRRPGLCPGSAKSPVPGSLLPSGYRTLNPDGAGPAHAQGHQPQGRMTSALGRVLIYPAGREELQLGLPSPSDPAATRRTSRHLQDPHPQSRPEFLQMETKASRGQRQKRLFNRAFLLWHRKREGSLLSKKSRLVTTSMEGRISPFL